MNKTINLFLILGLISIILSLNFVSSQTCSGIVHSCSKHEDNQAACVSANCIYTANNGKCQGTNHLACNTYSTKSACQTHKCTWNQNPICGNGVLESGEACDGGSQICTTSNGYSGTQTCSITCSWNICTSSESCGDNLCNGLETFSNCPSDCSDTNSSSGIGTSGLGQTNTTSGTQVSTTPIIGGDGGVQSVIGIFPRYPLSGDKINYGKWTIKTEIYFAGEKTNSASIKAKSDLFEEDIILKHNQEDSEGMYSSEANIKSNINPGQHRITIISNLGGQYNEAQILVNLAYDLNVNFNLTDKHTKGKSMFLTGTVKSAENEALDNNLIKIKGKKQDILIFETKTTTDKEGKFLAVYPVKFSDPEGDWDIEVEAISEDGRVGFNKGVTHIQISSGTNYYSVNFLTPISEGNFKRGEIIPISIEVKDSEYLIEGANVSISTPSEETIFLKEVQPGIYSGEYKVKQIEPMGKRYLKALAENKQNQVIKVGGTSLPIEITSTEIKFKLDSLDEVIFTNSKLKISTNLEYTDGSPVRGAQVNAILSNGKILSLIEKKDGVYGNEYLIESESQGSLNVEIRATDSSDNKGIYSKSLIVKQRSKIGNYLAITKYYLLKYWWATMIMILSLIIIYKPFVDRKMSKINLKKSIELQKKIKELQIETEKRYYKKGEINKKEFNEIMLGFEQNMTKAREKQKEYQQRLNKNK